MWRGSCQNFPGKLRQGTHLQLVSHLEVSADPISRGHPSGLSIASSGCRCPLEDPPFPSPGLPSFTPEDQGWGLTAAWSRKCSAPAVGSAKLTGHPVGHGPHQSPTAPAITGGLWNGENSTSAQLPDFSISDGPALQPCPDTPSMALGCTCTRHVGAPWGKLFINSLPDLGGALASGPSSAIRYQQSQVRACPLGPQQGHCLG